METGDVVTPKKKKKLNFSVVISISLGNKTEFWIRMTKEKV